GDSQGIVRMLDLYGVPANMSFVLRRYLFIEPLPLEPELGFIIGLPRTVVDAIEIELPHATEKSSFDGNAVANFPAEALGRGRAGNCALAVFHKVLPLLFWDIEFRIDPALVIHVNGKLRKEILFVLINAAKPVGIRDLLDAGNSLDLVRICQRQRLDDGCAINNYQAVGPGNVNAAAESHSHHGEHAKQKQCHRKRSNGQDETNLFAKQIGANESKEFHRPPPLETICNRSASTSTPFSKCSVTSARAATTGSCVTINTVFLYSFTSRRISSMISSALLRSRSPVGSSQSRNVGSETMARAIVTRCSCPPESCLGKWCMRSANPTTPRAVSTCLRRSALDSFVNSNGSSTFW